MSRAVVKRGGPVHRIPRPFAAGVGLGVALVVGLLLLQATLGTLPVGAHPLAGTGTAGSKTSPAIAAIKVKLVANPANLTLGGSVNLSAQVTGGTGWLNYTWPALPVGCVGQNRSSFNCTPSEIGRFTVTVSVIDGSGHSATNSTSMQVSSAQSNQSSQSASTVIPFTVYMFALILGVVAAAIASLVVVVFLRRRRRPPEQPVPERMYIPPKNE